MAMSEEENSKLAEVEQELAADRLLSWLFTAPTPPARPGRPRPDPARRMLCSRPQRRPR